MKFFGQFKKLTKYEWILWLTSVGVITVSFLISPSGDILSLIASLIGVTSLIFVAKGLVLGHIFGVAFAIFYGVISFFFSYYGEMITYLCMTMPIAVFSIISWIRHPYGDTDEVQVNNNLKKTQIGLLLLLTVGVTAVFYFILGALGNANLLFSTLSITTSFLAASLSLLRSPYYAIAYAANDIVLIVLWTLATMENPAYLPMIICFVMFLVNDIYGFMNWQKMKVAQAENCG